MYFHCNVDCYRQTTPKEHADDDEHAQAHDKTTKTEQESDVVSSDESPVRLLPDASAKGQAQAKATSNAAGAARFNEKEPSKVDGEEQGAPPSRGW